MGIILFSLCVVLFFVIFLKLMWRQTDSLDKIWLLQMTSVLSRELTLLSNMELMKGYKAYKARVYYNYYKLFQCYFKIASYSLLAPGPILGPEIPGEFFIWSTETTSRECLFFFNEKELFHYSRYWILFLHTILK